MYPAPASKHVGLAVKLTAEEAGKLRKRLASGEQITVRRKGAMTAKDQGDNRTRVKELQEIVKELNRVIKFRDAEIESLRGLLIRIEPFKCSALIHQAEDQHRVGESCPVEEKFRKAGFMAG